jgi:eukaryotic-like serine/threonine-protein kinase
MQVSTTLPIPDTKAPLPVAKSPVVELAPGTLLGGSYRLIRCLGHGGMGDIHLACRVDVPRQVVIKVLRTDLIAKQGTMVQEATVRFRQEATVMASLHHPNVVRLLDFDVTEDGRPYLIMEYLPGQNLGDVLMTRTFSVAQVSTLVHQVASALDAAHQLGVVHRDLKPENIMVVPRNGQNDLIKLIDFGICKARSLNHLTSKGIVMGTPDFMSPEQAQGRHEDVEAPSDQFALAVITYLLLAGRMPWAATTPAEALRFASHGAPLSLTDDGSYRTVEAVLFRAMAKTPSERYPSILAFSGALDRALAEAGLLPVTVAPSATRGRRSKASSGKPDLPRKRGTQIGRAAMFLMVMMFGGYLASTPTIRSHASQGWNSLQGFAAGPVTQGAFEGHRWISKVSKNARVYLSLATSR